MSPVCSQWIADLDFGWHNVRRHNNHNWKLSNPYLKQLLDAEPDIEATIENSSQGGATNEYWDRWTPNFAKYDCVLLNYNGQMWHERQKKEFEDYIRGGGTAIIVHATNNSFTGWTEYEKMVALPIQKGNYDFWAMVGGNYASLLSDWYSVFGDRQKICFFDDLVKGKHDFVSGRCEWLDLDPIRLIRKQTRVENKSMLYRSKDLQRVATSFDSLFSGVWYYMPWLKWPFSAIYNLLNAKPHTETISDSHRSELEAYYQGDIGETRAFLKERQIGNLQAGGRSNDQLRRIQR